MPSLDYNFKNNYDSLDTVNAFYTVRNARTQTEEVTVDIGGNEFTADAITGDLGELIFNPDFSTTDPIISDNNFFFDFGDGNIGTGLSAKHTYSLPGDYKVTFVVTDSAGNFFRSLQPKTIKVRDVIQDQIFLTQTLSTQNFSRADSNLCITRYNSVNGSRLLSSNNFSINITVSGNKNDLTTQDSYNNDINFHLKNNSFFTEGLGKEFKVIDSIQTNNTLIYGIPTIIGGKIVLSLTQLDSEETFFLGSSGFKPFRYIED